MTDRELNDHIATLRAAVDQLKAETAAHREARKDFALATLQIRRIAKELLDVVGNLESAVIDDGPPVH